MATFWDYFSVLAPSVGLALIFWLVMRSVFRVDTNEREAKAVLEEREAQQWASERDGRRARDETAGEQSGDSNPNPAPAAGQE